MRRYSTLLDRIAEYGNDDFVAETHMDVPKHDCLALCFPLLALGTLLPKRQILDPALITSVKGCSQLRTDPFLTRCS